MINGQAIKSIVESHGLQNTSRLLSEALALGRTNPGDGVKPDQFSIKELAEAFCGENWVRNLDMRRQGQYQDVSLLEAGEAVDVSAFSNITGQIFFEKIYEGWTQVGFIGESLCTNMPSKLDGEKIPWIGNIIGEGEEVKTGMPYPETSFGEQFIETPRTKKQGVILSISKETIFFDRTGVLLQYAGRVGERLHMNKEKDILNMVLGVSSASNTFKWKGSTFNTYLASGSNWVNAQTGRPLVDWTDVEQAEILFSKILDPDTNLPIVINPRTLLVMPAKMHTARRIVSATEIRSNNLAPAPNQTTISANPLNPYEVLASPMLYQQATASTASGGGGLTSAQANDYWFLGEFTKAFLWVENWPITVVQAPANATSDFERDIVLRYKASFRGTPAIMDPRYVVRMNNT